MIVLLPDTEQASVYASEIAPNLRDGDALLFAHGFNIRFGQITPAGGCRRDHGRPEGPGPPGKAHLHRRWRGPVPHRRLAGRFGKGARARALVRGRDRRHARRACSTRRSRRRPRPTCSVSRWCSAAGSPRSSQAGFETLVDGRLPAGVRVLRVPARGEADRRPHVRTGDRGMRFSISDTAEYGDLTRGPVVIDERVREKMRQDPGRHPVGGVRRRVDRREPRWPPEFDSCAVKAPSTRSRRSGPSSAP